MSRSLPRSPTITVPLRNSVALTVMEILGRNERKKNTGTASFYRRFDRRRRLTTAVSALVAARIVDEVTRYRFHPAAAFALEPLALARARDRQRLAVLRDRPSRDPQVVLLLELRGQLLVRQRLGRILRGHELGDALLDAGLRSDLATLVGRPAREEELEREDPARRLHVLARH